MHSNQSVITLQSERHYDFQATVAHEFGHVLGFDHPDVVDWLNLRAMTAAKE